MTLRTTVLITAEHAALSEQDARDVFTFCRTLLDTPLEIETVEDAVSDGWRPGQRMIGNPPGAGLVAWLKVWYGTGPVEVTFDTPYGYRGKAPPTPSGSLPRSQDYETCNGLHARLVATLGHWLDQRDTMWQWQWQNEYTGGWFHRFDGLVGFSEGIP